MSERSTIEWTDATWNPTTGCDKISPGCAHCYAERFAERWRGVEGHPYERGFDLQQRPERLGIPLTWKKPLRVFVNSMSDLMHEGVSDDFVLQVFETMRRAHWHRFQLLTKRPERLLRISQLVKPWPENVWTGVSIETSAWVWRADWLRQVPAAVRFLSCEPLLGPLLNLSLEDIHWVIVGGESGAGCRPMNSEWVRQLRDRCVAEGVPFFFKQWGGLQKKRAGRELDGRAWDQLPLPQMRQSCLL
ncbi:MAG: phage Gp37/Gp68 family protein [Gemmatimonadaceae bacterium]|nr:phage Gp37/Gp68 family protein [Gloeobacterales cyanobacterium ES-bin-141]